MVYYIHPTACGGKKGQQIAPGYVSASHDGAVLSLEGLGAWDYVTKLFTNICVHQLIDRLRHLVPLDFTIVAHKEKHNSVLNSHACGLECELS